MIDTQCPFCKIESEADDIQLGKAVRCPGCRKVFILHAHSTEIPLDPIIPGVPVKKADEALPSDGQPDTVKTDIFPRHTLKLKNARKTPLSRPRTVSPLLDQEPEPPAPESEPEAGIRRVVIAGVNVGFRDVFRTTCWVVLSALICGAVLGGVAMLVLGLSGKLSFHG